ncbi:hypothetical protein SAMCCGM7_Ch2949 [Sinorhizobium americanum CCGM7]|uniref:hypothetical protein n=1 Tax=Sinorhizobium americanum TaxID=194963 RepID=UPI0004D89C80|nr:hypothetical protein [Sinorhizobium americanum]APG85679.1 hypothetical protein SAMCCGM7_Ch2949 [Sinorhizobium americanum CCGM7]
MPMSPVLRRLWTNCLAAAIAFMSAHVVNASDKLPPELEKLKASLQKYQDPVVAVRDGYFSTLGCVTFATGTMGVHFLNPALIGPVPDPMKPTLLVYEPVGEKLQLVAVEWLIPLATGIKSKPELFGQPFDGPMEGHEPLLPAQLHHYDLHAWIFKPNPLGLFHPVNPDVKCPEGPYTFLEEAPKSVPHHGAQ